MICKWCGEQLDSKRKKCPNCGHEIPPMSECGGFYNVVNMKQREGAPPDLVQGQAQTQSTRGEPSFAPSHFASSPESPRPAKAGPASWAPLVIMGLVAVALAVFGIATKLELETVKKSQAGMQETLQSLEERVNGMWTTVTELEKQEQAQQEPPAPSQPSEPSPTPSPTPTPSVDQRLEDLRNDSVTLPSVDVDQTGQWDGGEYGDILQMYRDSENNGEFTVQCLPKQGTSGQVATASPLWVCECEYEDKGNRAEFKCDWENDAGESEYTSSGTSKWEFQYVNGTDGDSGWMDYTINTSFTVNGDEITWNNNTLKSYYPDASSIMIRCTTTVNNQRGGSMEVSVQKTISLNTEGGESHSSEATY